MARGRWRVLCLAAALALGACSDDRRSPEAEVRDFVARGVDAGEARSIDAIDALLHPEYLDQQGYNRAQLLKLLRAYFFRHENIHLFTRIDEIRLLGDDEAEVRLFVAMAGKVISDITALPALRARLYRFELRLLRDDEWRLQHARWEPANLGDLQ